MIQQPIRFDDGAAYERMMGAWSQLVGPVFLDWLSPATGQRWIDVGCGNGAFTEQLIERCAPVEARGIDPSEAQLAFARTRPGVAGAVFLQGDAMVLPFEADRFDAAVMALAIHFVPDLPKTRNAKILRRVVKAVYLGLEGHPPLLLRLASNPSALDLDCARERSTSCLNRCAEWAKATILGVVLRKPL